MVDIYVADKEPEKKPVKEKKKQAEERAQSAKEKAKKKADRQNPLAAYMSHPDNVQFETQERKEKIILLLRRHFITNLPWMTLTLVLALLPFSFRFFPILDFFPFRFQVVFVGIWYLLLLAFVLENFLSWYFNVDIVTDERIVDIDFYSLIYKEISHCKIDQIQDVTFKMGGVFRTLFNYGDVLIQTAAEVPVFEFESVPKPALVAKKLNDLILEEEKEKLEGRVR